MAWKIVKTTLGWLIVLILAPIALLVLLFALCLTPGDYTRIEQFMAASERWNTNTGFNAIAKDYSLHSAEALQARLLMIRTGDWVMFLRQAPNLPEHLQVHEGSREHYDSFSHGPLSAYLHLSEEQGVDFTVGMVHELAKKNAREPLTDAEITDFIGRFKMYVPAKVNQTNIDSIRNLVDEVGLEPFEINERPAKLMLPSVARIAERHGYPTELKKMTYAQQLAIYNELDGQVKRDNHELWRTKQVNDMLAGLWGQSYANTYVKFMAWLLWLRNVCLFTVGVVVVALIAWRFRKRRARASEDDEPKLATS